jgi:hypothetical protein
MRCWQRDCSWEERLLSLRWRSWQIAAAAFLGSATIATEFGIAALLLPGPWSRAGAVAAFAILHARLLARPGVAPGVG